MTRSTASRVVAVLILGAAISSSVLAAPTRSPMIASSIGARGLQSQSSSSDGLGTLSEGQTRELASLKDDVPRQSGDGLTIDDSSAHGRMIPSSIGARDLQPQSSSDGLGTLSEGQTEELARVPTPQRGGKNGDGPTIDDLEHGRSDPSGNVLLSVKLKQQVNIAERGNQMSRQERQRQARERQRQARERQRQTEAERQERAERENRSRKRNEPALS
ncbi:hypothetical protein EV361DRAFT_399044 [Lentinula raphanica]|nr:hypothetical protein EV361DRAFT_399044 [Lentinula raphanica]